MGQETSFRPFTRHGSSIVIVGKAKRCQRDLLFLHPSHVASSRENQDEEAFESYLTQEYYRPLTAPHWRVGPSSFSWGKHGKELVTDQGYRTWGSRGVVGDLLGL